MMHKIKFLIGLLFVANTFWAQKSAITTERGNTVTNHTNNAGPKITYGQTVLISVDTWLKDSLIQSTNRDNYGPREIVMPDSSTMQATVPAVFEAMLLMANGDSATVLQPVDSMMRTKIPEEFGEVSQIRFEVRVENVLTEGDILVRENEERLLAEAMVAEGEKVASLIQKTLKKYHSKKLRKKLKKTSSGLEYIILEKGTGSAINDGDRIKTHYYGVLKSNGEMFDNSFDRGEPLQVEVGSLVPGFNEGMKLLNKGGKAILFIPYSIGYGEDGTGPIPAKADLVFYIWLE